MKLGSANSLGFKNLISTGVTEKELREEINECRKKRGGPKGSDINILGKTICPGTEKIEFEISDDFALNRRYKHLVAGSRTMFQAENAADDLKNKHEARLLMQLGLSGRVNCKMGCFHGENPESYRKAHEMTRH